MSNNLITYLLEMNISLLVLFAAYKVLFEKDRNFRVRRIYLLGTMGLSMLIPLMPDVLMLPLNRLNPVIFRLDEVTIFSTAQSSSVENTVSFQQLLLLLYGTIFGLGVAKLLVQLIGIMRAVIRSEKLHWQGVDLYANKRLHASSFFGYIFLDPTHLQSENVSHILQHEQIHKQQLHSFDRILAEVFVLLNWFNPVAWMIRSSVIGNLEYLADSTVIRKGTDPFHYQLSILNQYIGSASLTNTFSSQIKNRINMLNQNYKTGSRWKITILFPLALLAVIIVSCTETGVPDESGMKKTAIAEDQVYTEVDEMPAFNGGGPMEFRMYIARNLKYPKEAAENAVTGKIFVTFIVRKDGRVDIPDPSEIPPGITGKEMGEVVVAVSYRSHDADGEQPESEYVELLKKEAIRVISSSPAWEPGKVNGTPVNVIFTFPINFVLQ